MKPIILAFLLLAMLAGCKKNDTSDPSSGLPDTSSSGKNILACKVNGQVHIYSGKGTIGNDQGVGYGISVDYIGITGNSSRYNDDIRLHISGPDSITSNKIYALSAENGHSALYISYSQALHPQYATNAGSGWVRFSRLDKDVAAGTFAFAAYLNGQQGNDSVVITDGRFDIQRIY